MDIQSSIPVVMRTNSELFPCWSQSAFLTENKQENFCCSPNNGRTASFQRGPFDNCAGFIPESFVALNGNRRNGSAWQVVNGLETQSSPTISPSPSPSVPVCAGSFANCPSVDSWCLGDAVIGAWCSHRRGVQKIPLTDATVNFFEFPGEHKPFILKRP